MKVQLLIQNGTYSDRVTVEPQEGASIGQMLYQLFAGQIAKIVIGKKRGFLKGIDLRADWSVSIVVDGKVLIDSVEVTASSETSFKLRLGLTDSGVQRFREGMCELTCLCLMPFLLDKTASIESGFILNRETIATQVKQVMKLSAMSVSELVPARANG